MDKTRALLHNFGMVAVTATITLLACILAYKFGIPNPVIILVVFMIFFTAAVSKTAGAVSGICIIIYALFFFSTGRNFVSFTPKNRYKCCIIIFSLLLIYIMVALICKKRDDTNARLRHLNEQLELQNKLLENESDHDSLTGIYNRRGGDRKVAALLNENQQEGFRAIVAAIDIDDFKIINDTYGHGAGDKALKTLVAHLREAFPDPAVLIRTGGDEFQVFLYGEDLSKMEQRIRSFASQALSLSFRNQELAFHVSCGYVAYPLQAESQKDLYRKADVALYDVKMNGKHQALPYTETSETGDRVKMKLSMRNIARNLPVSFMVYRADETEEILIASSTLLELCECSDFKEFVTYTKGTFRGFVLSEDLEATEKSIADQIHTNPRKLDTITYRIRTKSGRMLRIHDLGRLVQDPKYGDLFYVVLYDRDATSIDPV